MEKLPVAIAKEAGCCVDYICKINKGQRTPEPPMARQIIRAAAKKGIVVTLGEMCPECAGCPGANYSGQDDLPEAKGTKI